MSPSSLMEVILQKSRATFAKVKAAVDKLRGKEVNNLKRYGRDLTKQARAGKLGPVIGRDEEMRKVVRTLSKKTNNTPVLVGEPGVGKTVVEGLAQNIVSVPALADVRLIALDMRALLGSGTKFEKRLSSVLKEVEEEAKDGKKVILFVEDIDKAFCELKAMLERGRVRCIGATTVDECSKYVGKDAAAAFEQVEVLRGKKDKYRGGRLRASCSCGCFVLFVVVLWFMLKK